jgi:hypothetical protein
VEDHLTTNERMELETLEGVIAREIGSFMAVGKALYAIRDRKLYRERFLNFQVYCNERWGLGRGHANCLIRGSKVAANLLTHDGRRGDQLYTPCEIQPIHEQQVRPLTSPFTFDRLPSSQATF